MNKIILEADTKLVDKTCREAVGKNFMNIQKVNERTKIHTLDMRELRKTIKGYEKKFEKMEKELKKYQEKK